MPRGGKPKPRRIKIAEGNRSKVATDKIHPEPEPKGLPRVPAHLSAIERRLWADVLRSMPIGLITRADEGCLERYVIAWARFMDATKIIKAEGLTVSSPYGPIRHPLLATQNIAAMEMHRAGSELGLSPVARARMASPDAGGADPMDLLLGPDGDENGAWSTGSRVKQ
jgi:P27 family predicted phage terminase small subunit